MRKVLLLLVFAAFNMFLFGSVSKVEAENYTDEYGQLRYSQRVGSNQVIDEEGNVTIKNSSRTWAKSGACDKGYIQDFQNEHPVFKNSKEAPNSSPPSRPAKEPELKASEWFKKGEEAYQEKDYDQAIELFSKAVSVGGKEKLAKITLGKYRNRLGDAYKTNGDYYFAERQYKTAVDLNPKDANALLGRGACALFTERYSEAKKYVLEAVKLGDKDAVKFYDWMITTFGI